jgi:hypothetical protein
MNHTIELRQLLAIFVKDKYNGVASKFSLGGYCLRIQTLHG